MNDYPGNSKSNTSPNRECTNDNRVQTKDTQEVPAPHNKNRSADSKPVYRDRSTESKPAHDRGPVRHRLSRDFTDENPLHGHDSSISLDTRDSVSPGDKIEIQDFSPYDTQEEALQIDILEQAADNKRSWEKIFEAKRTEHPTAKIDEEEQTAPTQQRTQRSRQQKLHSIDPDTNQAYGDVMHQKQKNLSRFYFINPNGISHHRQFLDFYEILQSLKDNEIDVFGLSETNLDVRQPEVRKQLEEITQAFYGTSLLASSTSKVPARTPYKPGGTITGISNELCGRFQTCGSDSSGLGRWSHIQLYGKDGRSLVIITAYRVCEGKISTAGASTAYHQQWHLIRQAGVTQPNPRKQFIHDLSEEIKHWRAAGADIILGGDFNEKLGDSPDGLARVVVQNELLDPHAILHGTEGEPSTYTRGTKRLDYVFVSPRVMRYIKTCGIDPFHQILFTDHRGLFLDIDLPGLLGGEMAQIQTPNIRGVSSMTDQPDVYIKAVHHHLVSNKAFTTSDTLLNNIKYYDQAPPRLVKGVNKIDSTVTRGMIAAEIKCRRTPRPAWSKALAEASREVKFWKIFLSGIMTKTDVNSSLHLIGASLKWDVIPRDKTLPEVREEVQTAQTKLNTCRKEAADLRQSFLEDQIEAAAQAEDTTTEKMLKKIKHREAQSACFRKLAYALKPAGSKGGVTKVELEVDGATIAFTEKQDVERETKKRNQQHFNQAAGTPFTIFPLSQVGITATKFKTTQMPDGTPVKMPVDTFLETTTLLELLKRPLPGAEKSEISSRISLADFTKAINVWNEKTSTSPSGRHLGHYKLLVKAYEDTKTTPEVKEMAREILQLIVDIMDAACHKGFSLRRWTKVVNVMIYKKPGVFLINKLRVIHLFEADYNMIIGTVFGRRAMYDGVDNNTIHQSQWAQPGRQCSDVVVMRELTLAVAKMTKTPIAGFENDASACYDRIVMNLVAATFERMGVPAGPLRLQEQTLLNVVHYLKTGFGTSASSYTSTEHSRIYGVGQGSKAGPVTWTAISSLLFEAQDRLGTGLTFNNPTGTLTHHRHSDGFVDDTTGYHSKQPEWIKNPPTIRTLYHGIQQDAQVWERLLWTSGGRLALDKCKFYIAYWKFDRSGQGSLMTKDELQTESLALTEGNTGHTQAVEQLDLNDSFRTLGIHKTISGNQAVQMADMKRKSDAYARGILSVNVTNFEAWTGLFVIWFGQMNYPLAATFLSRRECENIQRKAINASLSKCGFSRTTSRAVVFGSPWFGGLGWRHLFYEQGIQHVLLLIRHLRTPGRFHSLLHVNLQWYQVIAGTSYAPLAFPNAALPHLDHEWLSSTRQFLKHCSAALTIPEIPLPKPKRTQDTCIMDGFLKLNLKPTTIRKLNLCRLWLQVTLLSDISTLSGTAIERSAWLGLKQMPASTEDWPVQPRPTDKIWALWRKALSDSVCSNPSKIVLASRPGMLTTRLGAWRSDSNPQESSRWHSYLEHSTQRLFIPAPNEPGIYQKLQTNTQIQFSLALYNIVAPPQTILEKSIPPEAVPVEISRSGKCIRINRTNTPGKQQPIPAPHITNFREFMRTQEPWKAELLQDAAIVGASDQLRQHLLQASQLFLCSDGGAKAHTGSFGWVLATTNQILWECHGTARGWHANSFRSEAIGQLALLVFIETYVTFYQLQNLPGQSLHISEPWIRIATDNTGVLSRIDTALTAKTVFAGAGLAPEYDAVNEIVIICRRLPLHFTWEHVKGHQDIRKKWYEMTWMERLNVRADKNATTGLLEAIAQADTDNKTVRFIPSSKVALRIATTDITSHYATELRKAATRPSMLQYARRHYGWTPAQFDMIDWKGRHGASQKLRYHEKKFITKFTNQCLPMGEIYVKIDPSQKLLCSSCQRKPESHTHLYRCQARRVALEEDFLRGALKTFLQDNHTCPQLANTLIDTLYCDLHDGRFPAFRNRHGANEPKFRKLHQLQAFVGWAQMFQGRFVTEWGTLQEAFLEENNSELKLDRRYYTGDIWVRKLINLLWRTIRTQWDLRNEDRHGLTKTENHAIRHERLAGQITEVYAQAPRMLAVDRVLLDEPIDNKLRRTPGSLEMWLKRTRPTIRLSTQAVTEVISRTHKRITQFFQRKPTIDNPEEANATQT